MTPRTRVWLLGLALMGLLGPRPAIAQSEAVDDPPPAPVGLDALLKLPAQTPTPEARPAVGGATRDEWRLRFAEARISKQEAESRLAAAQAQLGELAAATSTWQVAAPGGVPGATTESGPLSYSLREEIRRSREEIARAEQVLDELRVEANLAGVPDSWTEPEPTPEVEPGDGFEEPRQ